MFLNSYIFVILSFLVLQIGYCQSEHQLDHFYINDGLSENSIFSMEIDTKGTIWLGTLNGLNKFNGKKFTSYKPNVNTNGSIVGNNVTAIKEDTHGNIWALTKNGGLNKFDIDKKRFFHFNHQPLINFSDESRSKILVQNDSLLWLKKKNGIGVYNIKTNQFQSKIDAQFTHGFIRSNKSNTTILTSGKFGIKAYKFDQNRLITTIKYTKPIYYLDHYNDNYIVINDQGIVLFDKEFTAIETLVLYNELEQHCNVSQINSLAINSNHLWIGAKNGIHFFSKEKHQIHKITPKSTFAYCSSSLSEHSITNLKYDTYGNLWIGTQSFGFYLYNKQKNQFNFISRNKTALNASLIRQINPVCAISKSTDNKVWVGTKNKGIEVYDKKGTLTNYTHVFNKKGKKEPIINVREIFQDSKQHIWIATEHFIGKFNAVTNQIETLDCFYDWEWPYKSYCIKEFSTGKLTLTGANAIGEVDLNTGKLTLLPTKIDKVALQKDIRDIALDDSQNLWVVQNKFGLIKIDKNRTTYKRLLKSSSGFSDNKIYALEIDGDNIWVATNSGLNLFSISKNKVIKTFFEEDGLSSNIVYSVKINDDKNLWMSTSKGVSQLNTTTHKITTYLLDEFFFR
ncbi:ligand-binding sensor domain-containing protein [Aquimarina agarivorans]|uniref:ligand-binding sensor domain-containing protein n=1 Tax=Aquimarina agarivorans TaxID=980584 RepID=UPI000248F8FC|nr:two-component regulator propeller domain-containing protein [Aquimarina agarivorans]